MIMKKEVKEKVCIPASEREADQESCSINWCQRFGNGDIARR